MSGSSYLYTVAGAVAPKIADWMIGVPQATLQQWLTQAQGAYQALMTGAMAQTVTYANGSGNRSVTYSKAQGSALYAHIRQLQTALGNTRPRRAARVQF